MQLEQSVQEASYPLRHDIDLHLTVMAVRRLPFIANLSEVDRAMLSTVVSELGSNILKYAQRGDHPHPPPSQRAPLHRHRRPRSGPRHWGRASGHAGSLQHFGHPGPGLPGVRRMMSELTISTPPEGELWCRPASGWARRPWYPDQPPLACAGQLHAGLQLAWASENRPCYPERVSGDLAFIRPGPEGCR